MNVIFFDSWNSIYRTLIIGVLAYIAIVFLLRISGKRSLSKMNAFDFIVTIALGSTLATVLLSKDVALADGVLAFALLIGLQFVVTWLSVRIPWVKRLVTGEPHMLVYQGQVLPDAMRRARVTKDELHAALRSQGVGNVNMAEAVVFETDGSFTVLPASNNTDAADLTHVKGPHHDSDNKPDRCPTA